MSRFRQLILFFLLLYCGICLGQYKYEREYRVKKDQFPAPVIALLQDRIANARKLKFYRETDSTKVSYVARFRLDRLDYSVEFDESGRLEDIEISIKEVDIPQESLNAMKTYIDSQFTKYRIRRMQQKYPHLQDAVLDVTLNNAFQNLILPSIRYELIVDGKIDDGYVEFEFLFDADGNFMRMRKS